MVTAIIEIPKGDSTRRYYNKSQNEFVEIGSLKDFIPVNNGVMPVNFGFIPEAANPSDHSALDVLVITDEPLKVGQQLQVNPIAILKREDGADKIVAVDTNSQILSWDQIDENLRNLVLSYFSYKSKINVIGEKEEAVNYIQSNSADYL